MKSFIEHEQEVRKLQEQIKNNRRKKISLFKNHLQSNTMRNGAYKEGSVRLNLSHLKGILAIDKEECFAIVEPGVSFKELCEETLHYGLIPQVVPEFESITIGGAIMGAAIESSSHLNGQFNDSCMEYEILLGDGSLIKASANENSELFYAISGSYGTLGLLTAVKLRLVKATAYVLVTYHYFTDAFKAFAFLREQLAKDEFIEGVMPSENTFIWITAKKVETDEIKNKPIYHQNHFWSPWFYQHIISTKNKEEIMPLKEYLFRWNRGAFWMGRFLLKISLFLKTLFFPLKIKKEQLQKAHFIGKKTPSLFFRLLFGWAFKSQSLYSLWHKAPKSFSEQLFFVQDFYLPLYKNEEAIINFQKEVNIYPVWLCPVKATNTPQFLSPHFRKNYEEPFSHFLNVGLYGIPASQQSIPELTKKMEIKIEENRGRKMLYSNSYFDKDFFQKVYDMDYYFFLRQKYRCDNLISLYQKIIT